MKKSVAVIAFAFFFQSLLAQTPKYDSLEAIITGSVSIYRSSANFFYLEKDDSLYLLPPRTQKKVLVNGTSMIKKNEPYKGILNYHLFSCKNISKYLTSLELEEKDLIKLMNKYYECTGENATYIESSEKRVSKYVGAIIGVQQTNLDFKGLEFQNSSFSSHTGIFIGASYEVSFIKHNIALGVEGSITKANFSGNSRYWYNPNQSETIVVSNKFNLDYTLIKTRLFIKVNIFKLKKTSLYLKPAINLNFLSTDQEQDKTEIFANAGTVRETQPPYFFKARQPSIGIYCGLGFRKSILNDRFIIHVETGTELLGDFSKESDIKVNPKFISGQLGLAYKLKALK